MGVCGVALIVLSVVNVRQAVGIRRDARTPAIVSLVQQTAGHLPKRDGDVIVRCAGDESCLYGASLFLGLEKRGVRARTDTNTGVIGADAQHLVHHKGPVTALLTVMLGEKFDAQYVDPRRRLVAYWGDLRPAVRADIARRSRALDVAYKAGTIDASTLFRGKLALPSIGTAIGVFMDEPTPDR
jgi:hypothetical protein